MTENTVQMDIQQETGGRVSEPAKLSSSYLKRNAAEIDEFLDAYPNVVGLLNGLSDHLAKKYEVSQIVLECLFDDGMPLENGDPRHLSVLPKYNTDDLDELMKIDEKVFKEYLRPLGPSVYNPLVVSFSSRLSGYDNALEYL